MIWCPFSYGLVCSLFWQDVFLHLGRIFNITQQMLYIQRLEMFHKSPMSFGRGDFGGVGCLFGGLFFTVCYSDMMVSFRSH